MLQTFCSLKPCRIHSRIIRGPYYISHDACLVSMAFTLFEHHCSVNIKPRESSIRLPRDPGCSRPPPRSITHVSTSLTTDPETLRYFQMSAPPMKNVYVGGCVSERECCMEICALAYFHKTLHYLNQLDGIIKREGKYI